MVHTIIGNTVETTGDRGFGVAITRWPSRDAAIEFAQRMASICGGEIVVQL